MVKGKRREAFSETTTNSFANEPKRGMISNLWASTVPSGEKRGVYFVSFCFSPRSDLIRSTWTCFLRPMPCLNGSLSSNL